MKQFSPMLMNAFMRRLLTIIGILIAAVSTYAAPVKYIGCSPESGSEISSFDFTLNFDITEAIAELGAGEWGLGYNGLISYNRCARLYKGTEETGTELAIALTPNFTGKSEGFTVNGSTISMSFPLSTAPEEGQLYTIVIRNIFTIYESGKAVPKSAVSLSYEDNPLVLTFIGASAQSTELVLQSISIDEGTNLETINEIEFSFNEDIAVNDNAKVSIYDGETAVYHSELCEIASDRKNVLRATFTENTDLYNSHKYTITIPEGTVSLASNTNKTNKSISLTVNGTKMRYFGLKSSYPENNFVGLPSKANVVFDLPNGTDLYGRGTSTPRTALKIYEGSMSTETEIKQIGGTLIENATVIEWSLDNFQFKPSTDYILCMEKGTSSLFDADKDFMPEWSNEEVLISFTTPSIENSGIPQLEFGQAIIGQHNTGQPLVENMELASLQELNIGLKDNIYIYNTIQTNKLTLVPDVFAAGMNKGQLYEITADGDVLVKEFPVMAGKVIETYDSYSVLGATLSATLYEGKRYRIVIPAGIITIPVPSLYNYVLNPELSYTVIGTTPTEAKILSCTLEDNAEMSELSAVVWAFNGDFTLAPDAKAMAVYKYFSNYYPLTLQTSAGTSYLMLNLNDFRTGNPIGLSDGVDATITVPAGILLHPTDESITNKEIVLNIKGNTAAPAVSEPEFVTVTVLVKEGAIASKNDIETVPTVYSYTLDAVKEKKFKLGLNDGDWKLGSLYRDGIDVLGMTDDDGIYTTPALKENTVIAASLEYRNGDYVTIDQTTGVGQIPGTKYIVRIDAGHIVISGLESNETINVYNMAGIAVANTAVTAGTDIVRIGAQPGQYIVLVNETPFKAIVR